MSSAEFLYFIKAWAIWTEWRGQSIWPDTVWDDPFLTPSLSCALYYGRVSSIFLLPEKWWYCVSWVTGERNAWMWEVARKSSCIFSDVLLYPLSLCAADTSPNKIRQGRREWGLIVFCRYRGQYQRSALLGTRWDSICRVKSVPFLLTSWLELIVLHSVLNKSSRAAHCGLPPSRTSIQTQISLLQLGLIKPANKILYNRLIVVVVVVADIRSLAIASPVRTFLQTTDMSWTCHRLYIHSTFITWLFTEKVKFEHFQFKMSVCLNAVKPWGHCFAYLVNSPLCFPFFNFCLSLLWRLVCDSSKINGLCPVEHILFCFVQYIMPINQQYVCNLPSCCQHSLGCARFGQQLNDKFPFWGPQEYVGVAGLIY